MSKQTASLYESDIEVTDITGKPHLMSEYAGKVLLIVNTASKCGFTKQYDGLEKLYKDYKDKGLLVLGFPCNQFRHQEPGTAEEIQEFCRLNFGVSFPLFQKIDVNGDNTHPLYAFLKQARPGLMGSEAIKWNFTKFLVDKRGQVVERFSPDTDPEKLREPVERLLHES